MNHVGNVPAAGKLRQHAQRWEKLHLADVIDQQPQTRSKLRVSAAGLSLDYSRQRLDQDVFQDLIQLACETGLADAIQAMVAGEVLNASESRQVLHMGLRSRLGAPADIDAQVEEQLQRQKAFVDSIHAGELVAPDGAPYTDVINIGIGGSDLGPRLVVEALAGLPGYSQKLRAHFLGNPDSADLAAQLAELDPRRCLCVLVSKSFSTAETHAVAEYVRAWMRGAGLDPGGQFVAVTVNAQSALQAGIPRQRQFGMWDWVGGRFSLWSAVGLSIALSLGWQAFEQLLAGAADMDSHFLEQPLEQNLPVIWALLVIWNQNFLPARSQILAVYSQRLASLPAWLQQLDMESNGKSVGRDGQRLSHATAPPLWGGVGTSVQHAFFQMLHQGPDQHAVDFVLPREVPGMQAQMQTQLLANALGQAAALSHGRSGDDDGHEGADAAWRRCGGNHPSSLIWLQRLDARGLGQLLAAYEHRCFVQGWLWGLNSFDQFGVELGKRLAQAIEAGNRGDDSAWPDPLLKHQADPLPKG